VAQYALDSASPAPRDWLRELHRLSAQDGVDIVGLLMLAAAGDKEATVEAGAYLRTRPNVADLVSAHSTSTEDMWLDHATAHPVTRSLLRRSAERMRMELTGRGASVTEKLLIDRVVLCWLQLQAADMNHVHKMSHGAPPQQVEHYDKFISRAQRRYLDAVKVLAQVRRLLVPAIAQVNVSQHQINVAEVYRSDCAADYEAAQTLEGPNVLSDELNPNLEELLTRDDRDRQ
jgi:hypothetical protein